MKGFGKSRMPSEKGGMKFLQEELDEWAIRGKPNLLVEENEVAIHCEAIVVLKVLVDVLQKSRVNGKRWKGFFELFNEDEVGKWQRKEASLQRLTDAG